MYSTELFHGIADALESAAEPLPIWEKPKHKSWVTPEIEELIKRRRKIKISNNEREYADLNREIKMNCSQAKEEYLNNKCLEMEQVYNELRKSLIKKSVRSLANRRVTMGNVDVS